MAFEASMTAWRGVKHPMAKMRSRSDDIWQWPTGQLDLHIHNFSHEVEDGDDLAF